MRWRTGEERGGREEGEKEGGGRVGRGREEEERRNLEASLEECDGREERMGDEVRERARERERE